MESHAAEENLPSLSRLACASSSISVTGTISTVKTLASIVSEIILIGVRIREKYHKLFSRLQTPNDSLCNENRREVTRLGNDSEDNKLWEAQRNGEGFPGKPQVRPSVYFGSPLRKDKCQKLQKKLL